MEWKEGLITKRDPAIGETITDGRVCHASVSYADPSIPIILINASMLHGHISLITSILHGNCYLPHLHHVPCCPPPRRPRHPHETPPPPSGSDPVESVAGFNGGMEHRADGQGQRGVSKLPNARTRLGKSPLPRGCDTHHPSLPPPHLDNLLPEIRAF